MSEYKQFKLTSGEEIICEVLEWQSYSDDDVIDAVIARNVFCLIGTIDFEKSVRYYTFKPYMMYQENKKQLISINANHITCSAIPHSYIIEQWQQFIVKSQELNGPDEEPEKEDLLDERLDRLDEMLNNMRDSDNKIIKFDKNKVYH